MAEIHDERPDRWLAPRVAAFRWFLGVPDRERGGEAPRLPADHEGPDEPHQPPYPHPTGAARTTLLLAAGAGITVALALYRQTPP
jgi:hypothetical protein